MDMRHVERGQVARFVTSRVDPGQERLDRRAGAAFDQRQTMLTAQQIGGDHIRLALKLKIDQKALAADRDRAARRGDEWNRFCSLRVVHLRASKVDDGNFPRESSQLAAYSSWNALPCLS